MAASLLTAGAAWAAEQDTRLTARLGLHGDPPAESEKKEKLRRGYSGLGFQYEKGG